MSQTGYQFIFLLQQHEAQEEAERQVLADLPDSSFEIIESTKDLDWVEEGREFYRGSTLYDVIKVKNLKGKVFLYCLNDKKEQKVIGDFARAVKSRTNSNSKSSKQAIKFAGKIYTCQTLEVLTLCKRSAESEFCSFVPSLLSHSKEVIVPPPRA